MVCSDFRGVWRPQSRQGASRRYSIAGSDGGGCARDHQPDRVSAADTGHSGVSDFPDSVCMLPEGEPIARRLVCSEDHYVYSAEAIFSWIKVSLMNRFSVLATLVAVLLAGCRSEEHTSELQSLMRISYAVYCLK